MRAADLMAATLDRIDTVNGPLNAIVSMREREALMTEARAADRTEAKGPLHGLPLAVKDLADAAGLPTSHGSPAFAGQIAAVDSPHIAPFARRARLSSARPTRRNSGWAATPTTRCMVSPRTPMT